MTKHKKRAGLALAVVASAAAAAIGAVPTGAFASHGGIGDQLLTSYDGSTVYQTAAGGSNFAALGGRTDGFSWSPDGSRIAYVGTDNYDPYDSHPAQAIMSVRYDGGATPTSIPLVWGVATGERSHPVWSSGGSGLYFAERASSSVPWSIGEAPSTAGWGWGSLTTDATHDYTWPDSGPSGVLVAQRQADDGAGNASGTPDVVSINVDTGVATQIIDDARQPSVSPDGLHLAFVRSDGTNDQIYVSDMSGGNVTAITAVAADFSEPTWSPDGSTIAFVRNDTGDDYVAAADGSDAAAPQTTTLNGFPAWQTNNVDHVVTLAGADRYGTAIAISQSHWATAGDSTDPRPHAQSVVLTRSDTYADAVSGSALAAAKNGPLLMTPPTSFRANIKAEMQRVLGDSTTATVYILGDTVAISASTETAIRNMGYQVHRLAGPTRYDTSLKIAAAISSQPQFVMVATGMNFPDALGAGAAAGSYDALSPDIKAVVVLTNNTTMPTSTESYLDDWINTVNSTNQDIAAYFAVGDQAATALNNDGYGGYTVLAGENRYATAKEVAVEFFGGVNTSAVTTGLNWPDALAGGALCGTINAPLLLTNGSTTLNADTQSVLSAQSGSINTDLIFGDTLPVSINAQIGTAISGPAGFDTAMVGPANLTTTSKVAPTLAQPKSATAMSPHGTLSHR